MPFIPLCTGDTNSNLNATDHDACTTQPTVESSTNFSLQVFLTLFLIIGLLVLFILFVSRIRSLISSPKHITHLPSLNQNSVSPAEHSLFYLSNNNLNTTPTVEMLARIRSDLLTAAIVQQQNNLNRIQLNSIGSNQVFLLNASHSSVGSHSNNQTSSLHQQVIEMVMFELPPPSYSEVTKVGDDNESNETSELPPPSYNQLKLNSQNK